MIVEELLCVGCLDDVLKVLQEQVCSQLLNVILWIFLFQLLVVMGQWVWVQNQFKVVGELDVLVLLMVQIYFIVIDCEVLCCEVFVGCLMLVIFGQLVEWIVLLLQVLSLDVEGYGEVVQVLCEQVFDVVLVVFGWIGEVLFVWLVDVDMCFGLVFEVIVNGCYVWLLMSNLCSFKVEVLSDLCDLVWLLVELILVNGGVIVVLLLVCYVEIVEYGDDVVCLGCKIEWLDSGLLVGQWLFVIDVGEIVLFDLCELDFELMDV